MRDNFKKGKLNSTLTYILIGVFLLCVQAIRLSSIEFYTHASYTGVEILVLISAVPMLLLFFVYIPILFILELSYRVVIYIPIKSKLDKVVIEFKSQIILKSKQSSLQVFRC